jgi:hypothetical protein
LVIVFGAPLLAGWRRLIVGAVVWRPVPFISVLERPG